MIKITPSINNATSRTKNNQAVQTSTTVPTNTQTTDTVSFKSIIKPNQIDARNQASIKRLEQIWRLEKQRIMQLRAEQTDNPKLVEKLRAWFNPVLDVPDRNSDYRACRIVQIGTETNPVFSIKDGVPDISRTSITFSTKSDQAKIVEESFRYPLLPFLGPIKWRTDKIIKSSSPAAYRDLNVNLNGYLEPVIEHYSELFRLGPIIQTGKIG